MTTLHKTCPYCQQEFDTNRSIQIMCGKPECAKAKKSIDKSEYLAKKRQAATVINPAFAWATPAVCAAVAQGIEHPTAQKMGLFAVVHPVKEKPPLVHVPTHKLGIPPQYIVCIVRLNERGRWDVRPVIRSGQ